MTFSVFYVVDSLDVMALSTLRSFSNGLALHVFHVPLSIILFAVFDAVPPILDGFSIPS